MKVKQPRNTFLLYLFTLVNCISAMEDLKISFRHQWEIKAKGILSSALNDRAILVTPPHNATLCDAKPGEDFQSSVIDTWNSRDTEIAMLIELQDNDDDCSLERQLENFRELQTVVPSLTVAIFYKNQKTYSGYYSDRIPTLDVKEETNVSVITIASSSAADLLLLIQEYSVKFQASPKFLSSNNPHWYLPLRFHTDRLQEQINDTISSDSGLRWLFIYGICFLVIGLPLSRVIYIFWIGGPVLCQRH